MSSQSHGVRRKTAGQEQRGAWRWWHYLAAILLVVAATPGVPLTARAGEPTGANWADAYGTRVLWVVDGAGGEDVSGGITHLQGGETGELQFQWEVGSNPMPQVGDQLSITLPTSLRVQQAEPIPSGKYTSCHTDLQRNSVECEFTSAVTHQSPSDLHGVFAVPVAAVGPSTGQAFAWGGTHRARTAAANTQPPGDVGAVSLKGVRSGEYEYPIGSGQHMVQLLWNLEIPAEYTLGTATIHVHDSFATVHAEDSNTGNMLDVPQYLAPAEVGPLTVYRIEHETEHIVAQVNGVKGAVVEGPGRQAETVRVEGISGGDQWGLIDQLRLRIENPVPEATYQVSFHTVVPSNALPPGGGDAPLARHDVMVNNVAMAQGEVPVYSELPHRAALDLRTSDVVVKVQPEGEHEFAQPDKLLKVRFRGGGRAGTCMLTQAQPCYLAGFTPGEPIEVSEVEPEHAAGWKPGRFVPASADHDAQVDTEGVTANIIGPQPGQRIALTLNHAAEGVPPGALVVRNEVVGIPAAEIPEHKEFPMTYQCDRGSVDNRVRAHTPSRVKVHPGAAGTVVAVFPVGTTCQVLGQDPAAAHTSGYKLEHFDAGGEVVIQDDSARNIIATKAAYTQDENHLQVALSVAGDAQQTAKETHETLPFSFECSDGQRGGLEVATSGVVAQTQERFAAGTECTVRADEVAAQAGGVQPKLVPDVMQRVTIGSAEPAKFTATYTATTGTLGISKQIRGDAVVADRANFRFRYQCGGESGQVEVPGDGQVVEALAGVPLGTTCQVVEDPIEKSIEGFEDITQDSERNQEVIIDKEGVTTAEFTGTYRREVGRFQVRNLAAETGGRPRVYARTDFDYVCTHPGSEDIVGEIAGVGVGETKESGDIPTGYTCRVSPQNPSATVTEIGSPVRIAAASAPTVEVQGMNVPGGEAFVLTKVLAPRGGEAAGHAYEYECAAGDGSVLRGVLGPIGPGQQASSAPIPAGNTCVISEVFNPEAPGVTQVALGQDATTIIEQGGARAAEATQKYSDWQGVLEIQVGVRGGENVARALEPTEVKAHYSCVRADTVVAEGDVQVALGHREVVEGIAANAECTVSVDPVGVEHRNSKRVRLDPGASIMKANGVVTGDGGRAQVALYAAYVELGHVSVEKAADADRCEFDMVATWSDNGVEESKEFSVSAGQRFDDLPALPVGTKVLLKQRKPEGDNYQRWCTPAFTSSHAGSVVDERNGVAELSIVPNTPADDPQRITLTETKEIPWWWLIVPLALLPAHSNAAGQPATTLGPGGVGNGEALRGLNTGAGEGGGRDGEEDHEKGREGASQSQRFIRSIRDSSLVSTGASILGILGISALAIGTGVYLIRRN